MIKRMRTRFIILAMLSILTVLTGMMIAIHTINYRQTVGEVDELLLMLARNDGQFPEMPKPGTEKKDGPRPQWSPELPFETRYFYVRTDCEGKITDVETANIAAVDRETAEDYAACAEAQGEEYGFVQKYRYIIHSGETYRQIIFVDCGRILEQFWDGLFVSVGISALGCMLVFLLILAFSKWIVRPIAESYAKQKRFITDAGHELKTPLTVIGADVDVLEMEVGRNEWLEDIRRQAARLTVLTGELVQLARLEEAEEGTVQKIAFPVSDVIEEEIASFRRLAQTQNKELTARIQPMLTLEGNERAIRQLVTVLMDNAMKYSEAGGKISVVLERQGKQLRLEVYNTTAERINRDELPNFFDRFYRGDPSRSSEMGGYGIGLSVAKAAVDAHNGRISVSAQGEYALCITVEIPL